MVRTKADAATRVAAGGKAPKKTQNYKQHSPPEKLGKDHLPVNRYCPRETPTWQKKITFFYDKNKEANGMEVNQNEWPADKAKDFNGTVTKNGQPDVNYSADMGECESMDMD